MSTHICLAMKRLLTFCLTLMLCVLDSICRRKAYISICVCQVFVESSKAFNTLSKILLWIKPSYFQHGSSLSLENVCDSWCMHAAVVPPSKSTELPSSSAAVVPQSKSTEWCSSSAAAVPHKVNLTEYCSGSAAVVPHEVNLPSCEIAQRLLYHKVSPPRCEARRRLFILTCDIFGTGQTNMLFIRKNL